MISVTTVYFNETSFIHVYLGFMKMKGCWIGVNFYVGYFQFFVIT